MAVDEVVEFLLHRVIHAYFLGTFLGSKAKKNKGKPDLLFSDVSSRNFFHEPIKIVIHVSIGDLRNNNTVFH